MNTEINEQLYRKVQRGSATRYLPVESTEVSVPEPTIYFNLDEAQSLTAAGALGVVLLTIFEKNIPPHKVVAKKIAAVEKAILDLYKGTGKPIDDRIADAMCRAWDLAMKQISSEEGV